MKKNVFSRTLAVLASTAVLGAASMMTASAAPAGSITVIGGEGKAGDTVSVLLNIGCGNQLEGIDAVVTWDDTALTAGEGAFAVNKETVMSEVGEGYATVVAYGSGAIADGDIVQIDFTIPADAEVGTTYNIEVSTLNTFTYLDADEMSNEIDPASVALTPGTITVVADETEAPETTAAETTAAATTTTTAKAAATGAPKTGNAGVAVAVAGLVAAGATAVVLKKRH
ncbi:MAG: LPXTG cell wall anchor domain-containing protein [Oscillospiraceae bacterium]|nr:LPXTG cell wall anchor domain-containing protein [Oscillospiraceae bacterium]